MTVDNDFEEEGYILEVMIKGWNTAGLEIINAIDSLACLLFETQKVTTHSNGDNYQRQFFFPGTLTAEQQRDLRARGDLFERAFASILPITMNMQLRKMVAINT